MFCNLLASPATVVVILSTGYSQGLDVCTEKITTTTNELLRAAPRTLSVEEAKLHESMLVRFYNCQVFLWEHFRERVLSRNRSGSRGSVWNARRFRRSASAAQNLIKSEVGFPDVMFNCTLIMFARGYLWTWFVRLHARLRMNVHTTCSAGTGRSTKA